MKKKILCIIPARSGSKGIKNKNMIKFKGKPLLYWTIKLAKKIKYFDKIVVSTDSKKIQRFAKKNGVSAPFLRPIRLSGDNVPMRKVLIHAIEYFKKKNYQPYALSILQPTSPMRKKITINKACKLFLDKKLDSFTTIEQVKHNHNPDYIFSNKKEFKEKVLKKLRSKKIRQKEKIYFGVDGGVIFITRTKVIYKYILGGKIDYIVLNKPESIDIDNLDVLKFCEKIKINL